MSANTCSRDEVKKWTKERNFFISGSPNYSYPLSDSEKLRELIEWIRANPNQWVTRGDVMYVIYEEGEEE